MIKVLCYVLNFGVGRERHLASVVLIMFACYVGMVRLIKSRMIVMRFVSKSLIVSAFILILSACGSGGSRGSSGGGGDAVDRGYDAYVQGGYIQASGRAAGAAELGGGSTAPQDPISKSDYAAYYQCMHDNNTDYLSSGKNIMDYIDSASDETRRRFEWTIEGCCGAVSGAVMEGSSDDIHDRHLDKLKLIQHMGDFDDFVINQYQLAPAALLKLVEQVKAEIISSDHYGYGLSESQKDDLNKVAEAYGGVLKGQGIS
jgi:hypothetical protein